MLRNYFLFFNLNTLSILRLYFPLLTLLIATRCCWSSSELPTFAQVSNVYSYNREGVGEF